MPLHESHDKSSSAPVPALPQIADCGASGVLQLRVWHIPQIPGEPFHVPVESIAEAKKVLDVLANYDIFQFENRIKPDYCNASGLECFQQYGAPEPPENFPDWCEWESEDGCNIDEVDSTGAPL